MATTFAHAFKAGRSGSDVLTDLSRRSEKDDRGAHARYRQSGKDGFSIGSPSGVERDKRGTRGGAASPATLAENI